MTAPPVTLYRISAVIDIDRLDFTVVEGKAIKAGGAAVGATVKMHFSK